MKYIKKTIAPWEIKYGQIAISRKDYEVAKTLFRDYFGVTFELETFMGTFPNRHFIDATWGLRLACMPFFSKLNDSDTIYLLPSGYNKVKVTKEEPTGEIEGIEDRVVTESIPAGTSTDVTKLLVDLVNENKALREANNEELIRYKDRLEKYQNLEYIFEDERFMEDWLERNIHKALANLEVVDRQPVITWNEQFMRNKPDFFCLDKTTRELVIVENKVRGRHRKIETQFLSYNAWVKRNIDKINSQYKDKNLKATDNFKFVIITDTTDERLEAICEDSKIALVLIDGGVIFEEIIPYYE
ncbi:hypothetical protein ACFLTB_05885 [Chloroflexota bacterium]